jgi:hypothetical protein
MSDPTLSNLERPARILEYNEAAKYRATFCLYVFLIALMASGYLIYNAWKQQSFGTIEIAFTTAAFFWLYLYTSLRKRYFSKYQAYPEKLVISYGSSRKVIPYGEVNKVEYKKFFDDKLVIWTESGKYSFSVELNRIEYILEAIFAYKRRVMEAQEYENLRKLLVNKDHQMSRWANFFNKEYRLRNFFSFFIGPALATVALLALQKLKYPHFNLFYLFFDSVSLFYFVMMFFLLMAFAIYYHWGKVQLNKNMQEDENDKRRNMEHEQSFFKCLHWLAFVCYGLVIVGVYSSNHNMIDPLRVYTHYQDGDSTSKMYWLDKRHVCIDCRHPLYPGDKVRYNFLNVQVVGLPGQEISAHNLTQEGRSVASEAKVLIPEGHVSVVYENQQGRVMAKIIPISDIYGKLTESYPKY